MAPTEGAAGGRVAGHGRTAENRLRQRRAAARLGYHQRSHRERETAGSSWPFRSRRGRPIACDPGAETERRFARPSSSRGRHGRALAQTRIAAPSANRPTCTAPCPRHAKQQSANAMPGRWYRGAAASRRGSSALPVFKPSSHDLGYPAGRIGCSFRTISAAAHPRAARPLSFESGRRGGVSDLGGGGQPTAETSAASASRSHFASTRNVATAIVGARTIGRRKRSSMGALPRKRRARVDRRRTPALHCVLRGGRNRGRRRRA